MMMLGRERVEVPTGVHDRQRGVDSALAIDARVSRHAGARAASVTRKMMSGKTPSTTMRSRIGVHAIHSIGDDVVDVRVGELRLRLAERDPLEHPQQVAGGEHGADRGDDHERAEQRRRERPGAGLYADSTAGNSPQNPARPGSPSDAIAQKPRIQPIFGACFSRPPRRLISRVP